jgi:hypothetical protein
MNKGPPSISDGTNFPVRSQSQEWTGHYTDVYQSPGTVPVRLLGLALSERLPANMGGESWEHWCYTTCPGPRLQ